MASISVEQLVLDLADPATRENALLDLSKKRENFPELAPYLWHSFGTVSALLQVREDLLFFFLDNQCLFAAALLVEAARFFLFPESSASISIESREPKQKNRKRKPKQSQTLLRIDHDARAFFSPSLSCSSISQPLPLSFVFFHFPLQTNQEIVAIYPLLSPPALTAHASNRVCNALALLQCVASHPDTRALFLQAHVPLFLYPFLNTVSKTRPFEYLRLTSLGVVGALVKVDDTDVINFLLSTEIIPLCLRTMEMGSELSKTVATFIVQKILLDAAGLAYICATAERFFAVSAVLASMVQALPDAPSARLLKHVIRCYLRLSDNARAREALRSCLPPLLLDSGFTACLKDDVQTRGWLAQLLVNVGRPHNDAAFAASVTEPTVLQG